MGDLVKISAVNASARDELEHRWRTACRVFLFTCFNGPVADIEMRGDQLMRVVAEARACGLDDFRGN